MKIKKAHLDHIEKAINNLLANNPDIIQRYETGNFVRSNVVKDLQTRFNFDLLYVSGLIDWVCKEIYSYANDTHLATALNNICPKIERKY
jgi:hypothetical protein